MYRFQLCHSLYGIAICRPSTARCHLRSLCVFLVCVPCSFVLGRAKVMNSSEVATSGGQPLRNSHPTHRWHTDSFGTWSRGLQVQVHQKNGNGSHRRVHTPGFWHRDRNSGDTQKEFAILVSSDSSVFCLWMGFPNNVRLGAALGLSRAVMPGCGVV